MSKDNDDFDFSAFQQKALEQLQSGAPLTGKDGVMTPLLKMFLEKALDAELSQHLGEAEKQKGNRRNGKSSKKVKSSFGEFPLETPRDRSGSFEPQMVKKREVFLGKDVEQKIINLYGMGMSVEDIRSHIQEMYGTGVSAGFISEVTDQIIPALKDWQSRPLEAVYPIIWLDAMYYRIRKDGKVQTRCLYNVLAINLEGKKEVIGCYVGDHESASFWLEVLTNLEDRGVEDILIACIDNLKGFAEAIESVFPKTEVQLCIVHQIRNSLKYVTSDDQKSFLKDLKKVYQASKKEEAEDHLLDLEQKWGQKYAIVISSWNRNWDRLSNYFEYSYRIRKLIYTTNAVEGFHRQIRKVTKTKGNFPSDMALMKLVYLAVQNIEQKWTQPLPKWGLTISQLHIKFGERVKTTLS
jgi:transposase-like protein